MGLGGHPDTPEPLDLLSSDGARPREHRPDTAIRASGPRSRVGRPTIVWLADYGGWPTVYSYSKRFGNGTSDSANVLETLCRTVLL